MRFILQFVTAFILVPIIDYFWIGLLMKNFYLGEFGSLARTENGEFKPLLSAGVVVYLLLAAGIVCFVLPKADSNLAATFGYGALLGLIVYGVYDMTNLSTLQNWTLKLSITDMLWGSFLCGLIALIVEVLSQKFFPAA